MLAGLGPRILRAETAPLYALSAVSVAVSYTHLDVYKRQVKSVLSAKLLEAQNKGIGISVEIDEPVRDLFIEVLDFITFLSILCDNAIEASLESDDPQLTLAMLQETNSLILIVENSTKAEKIELARIFEKDYSSKGEGRGLGLYKIQQLLEKYPKTTVSTKSSNYRFTQSLTFWKE